MSDEDNKGSVVSIFDAKWNGEKTLEWKEDWTTTVTFLDTRATQITETEDGVCARCSHVLDARSKDWSLKANPWIDDLYCSKFKLEDDVDFIDSYMWTSPVTWKECQVIHTASYEKNWTWEKVQFRSTTALTSKYQKCDRVIEQMMFCWKYEPALETL